MELAHLSTSCSLPCCSSARTTYSSWDRDRCWVARPGLASNTATTTSHNSAIISDDAVVMLLRCCGDAPQFLPLVPSQPRLFRVLVRSAAPLRLMSPLSVTLQLCLGWHLQHWNILTPTFQSVRTPLKTQYLT